MGIYIIKIWVSSEIYMMCLLHVLIIFKVHCTILWAIVRFECPIKAINSSTIWYCQKILFTNCLICPWSTWQNLLNKTFWVSPVSGCPSALWLPKFSCSLSFLTAWVAKCPSSALWVRKCLSSEIWMPFW